MPANGVGLPARMGWGLPKLGWGCSVRGRGRGVPLFGKPPVTMTDPKYIPLRVTEEMASRLRALAEKRGESLNSTLLALIERGLAALEAETAH